MCSHIRQCWSLLLANNIDMTSPLFSELSSHTIQTLDGLQPNTTTALLSLHTLLSTSLGFYLAEKVTS